MVNLSTYSRINMINLLNVDNFAPLTNLCMNWIFSTNAQIFAQVATSLLLPNQSTTSNIDVVFPVAEITQMKIL